MNGVIGMAQLLEMTGLDTEQREYTGLLMEAGRNLLTVINDILDLSKIEAGRIEIEAEPFEPREEITATVGLLAPRARDKGLELVSWIDPEVPLLLNGDAGRIRQILTNLISNAVKFTAQGSVSLQVGKVGEDGPHITLDFVVRDTGIGIEPAKMGVIFAPFTQADGSTSRSYGGTGLGLTISRQLAELMGGSIGVESEPGAGSAFTFRVTLVKQDSEEQSIKLSQPEISSGNNTSVLLVEDEPTTQVFMRTVLAKFGYRVDLAVNGSEAVRALEDNDYALVLMDCMMPDMNGYEATAVIRDPASGVRNHAVPVIALTARAFKDDRDICRAAGMDDYLSKPVNVTDLLAVLEKWGAGRDVLNGENPAAEGVLSQAERLQEVSASFQAD
jgi:CheY-like chemotaxis protein